LIEITFESSLILALSLFFLVVVLIFLILLNNWVNKRSQGKYSRMRGFLINEFPDYGDEKPISYIQNNRAVFLDVFVELSQSLSSNTEILEKAIKYIDENGLDRRFHRNLSSRARFKRIEAASYLSNIPTKTTREALKRAIAREKNHLVKIHVSNALLNLQEISAIPDIVETLLDSPEWYQDKMVNLISESKVDLYDYLPAIIESERPEHQRLIVRFASKYIAQDLKEYLMERVDSDDERIAHAAVDALLNLYPGELGENQYIEHEDSYVRDVAITSLSKAPSREKLDQLIEIVEKKEMNPEPLIYSAVAILRERPKFISLIMDRFQSARDPRVRTVYSRVLSNRLEYFLLKLLTKDNDPEKEIIEQVVSNGETSDIIGFLNKNNNIELENEILSIIKGVCEKDQEVKQVFCTYLDERLVNKMNYEKIEPPRGRREEELDRGKVVFLTILLSAILLFFPTIYVWNHFDQLTAMTVGEHARVFLVDFIFQMTFYVVAVNLVFILLLLLSLKEVINQAKYWKVKSQSFLWKEGILPSISIIAPAYGEEATIIESSKSLLGLSYPDFQLVVVNDGSPDNTLNTLIDYYGLEKVDMIVNERLKTQPMRGLYTNPSYPNLIVVDKANGGKADALNVGINVASKDYICCIDADSLLEPTALLKIASRSLDYEEETVATGGNIMPINGCTVDRGVITGISIPKSHVARLQTIEYLRAFMAGRLGWTYINALLIISGAFGLFKRSRVIEIGGYLTSSERYRTDTVGEDMELVVRLSRHMRESKIPYRVQHAYNANCWTEVPESFSILKKQRDRWHRGLIDIIHFHRRIPFRPMYGSMGLISFPYFLIFEVIGPFFELMGYLAIVSQVIFGMLDWPVALLLFSAIVLMGILVSMTGILFTEYKRNYFTFKETAILLTYAFLENFGPRQIISLWRVGGYISSMKKPKGWGKMVRKGFSTQTTQGKP